MKLFDGFSEHRIYAVSGILELLFGENILVVLQTTFYTINVPIEVLEIHLHASEKKGKSHFCA